MKTFTKTSNINAFYDTDAKTLSTLANSFQTDKGTAESKQLSWGKDYPMHACWHYTETYEKYTKGKKSDSISIMEIGVCDKRFPYASIKMWMSYFKDVDFYAVDNFWGYEIGEKMTDIQELNESGVNFIYADQGSFTDWDEIAAAYPSKFDFVIEDGSHWPNHMMVSLWKSIPIVKKGGYLFMEDIQNPLKSRGWFKYDNSLVAQELLETLSTNKLYSSFLNDRQNLDIDKSYELVEMILDPSGVNYLAVFKRK